jgi:hypothetical protein
MLYGLKTGLEPFLFFMPAILVISAKNASRDCPFGTAPTLEIDDQDAMKMIGHDHEFIYIDV